MSPKDGRKGRVLGVQPQLRLSWLLEATDGPACAAAGREAAKEAQQLCRWAYQRPSLYVAVPWTCKTRTAMVALPVWL